MKSTFSVIYYLKRQVVKKDGTVPVMGRITVDGSQTQFSCKLTALSGAALFSFLGSFFVCSI